MNDDKIKLKPWNMMNASTYQETNTSACWNVCSLKVNRAHQTKGNLKWDDSWTFRWLSIKVVKQVLKRTSCGFMSGSIPRSSIANIWSFWSTQQEMSDFVDWSIHSSNFSVTDSEPRHQRYHHEHGWNCRGRIQLNGRNAAFEANQERLHNQKRVEPEDRTAAAKQRFENWIICTTIRVWCQQPRCVLTWVRDDNLWVDSF